MEPDSSFVLLPAVDVADGLAVRLVQGEAGSETSYGDPLDAALAWQDGGADWVHLSTGVIGADRRYIMAVQSLQPSDDATARQTITQAVKTVFPNGRI